MADAPKTSPIPSPLPAALPPAKMTPGASKTSSFLGYLFLGTGKPGEIVVFHHANLFYWWPVWACGFIMAFITYFGDQHMAIVPRGTIPAKAIDGETEINGQKENLKDRDILVLPENKKHIAHKDAAGQEHIEAPALYVAHHKSVGVIFMFVLLLVIAITNVHMRGLWSFFVLLVLVMLAVIFAAAGWWETILARLGLLSIHLNMGGYMLLSLVLFGLWLINFAIFDRQTYMIFAPGQVRMRLEIGGGETVYDTSGMVVQKYRSDLFRHWILGFGSGDLVIRPSGVAHPIEMPNVLGVGRKVRMIEKLVKEKVVLAQQ